MSKKKKLISGIIAAVFIISIICTIAYFYLTKTETIIYDKKDDTGVSLAVNVEKTRNDLVKEIKFTMDMPYNAMEATALKEGDIESVIKKHNEQLKQNSQELYGKNAVKSTSIENNKEKELITATTVIDMEKLSDSGKELFKTDKNKSVEFKQIQKSFEEAGFKEKK